MVSPYYNSAAAGGGLSRQDLDSLAGMFENSGSLQLKEIEQRYKLGKDQLSNAWKIAQLQSGDSRYGVDARRETDLAQIAQARAEMERIGIPQMEINRWVAEKNYDIAQRELQFKQSQWEQQFGLQQGELTGTYNGSPTLAAQQQQFQQGIDAANLTGFYGGGGTGGGGGGGTGTGTGTGTGGGIPTLAYQQFLAQQEELARRYGLDVGAQTGYLNGAPTVQQQQLNQLALEQARRFGLESGQATGYVNGQATVAQQQLNQQALEQARQYGLNVAQFGAQLASTPDTYYQSQRFNAVDLPQLMGMASQGYQGAGPTAGVARMGEYLKPGLAAGAGGGFPNIDPTTGGSTLPGPGMMTGGPIDQYGNPIGGGYGSGGYAEPGTSLYAGGSPTFNDGGGSGMYLRGGGGDLPYGGSSAGTRGYAESAAASGPPPGYTYHQGQLVPLAATAPAPDPRMRQIAQVAKAAPPSAYDGLNDTDASALRLMESIYKQGGQSMDAGSYARLKASGRTGFLQSAGKALGYDPKDLDAQWQAYRPSQESARLA